MRLVRRFSATERAFHWVNAAFFLGLLVTGLVLYLPSLEVAVGRRPLVKDLHFWTGVGWPLALAAVALAGDRRRLLGPHARSTGSTATTCVGSPAAPRRRAASTPARR